MKIYPAIDLYAGKVVRLTRGQFDKETVYSADPVSIALRWEEQGAQWLHIVDLEGAKTGILKNFDSVTAIRKAVKCRIQLGGGLRTLGVIKQVIEAGINRVVVGTKAVEKNFLRSLMEQFGKSVALGFDVRNHVIQTEGWLSASGKTIPQMLEVMKSMAVETLIYTDIQKDGMLHGPNFAGLEEILGQTSANVILSGGVSTLTDIEQCCRINRKNFDGVIIGKALYDKKFSLRDAIQVVKENRKV